MRWLLALVLLAGCARPSLPPAPVAPAVVSTLDQQALFACQKFNPQLRCDKLSKQDKQGWRNWVTQMHEWQQTSGQHPYPWLD